MPPFTRRIGTGSCLRTDYGLHYGPTDRSVRGATCSPFNNLGQTGPDAPVGFIDPATGLNISRALWNQAGIDVTFQPVVQYLDAGAFQTLHVTTDPNTGLLTSLDFQTLSQQPALSLGITPSAPLSPNPTTMNMFFVNTLVPQVPGVLYGFSWINNNGIAISANTFGTKIGNVTLPGRPDTIPHEIGHVLDLDHNTFGAGASTNLLTMGSNRTEPSDKIVNGQAVWVGQIPPNGSLDQLNSTQRSQVSLSGFLNPIPLVDTTVMNAAPPDPAFHVAFQNGGRPGESIEKLTLRLPQGLIFNSDLSFLGGVHPTRVIQGLSSLEFDFASGIFKLGNSLDYDIGICRALGGTCAGLGLDALAGATYSYVFSDLFETTSDFAFGPDGVLMASSQNPDPFIPSRIVDPANFVGVSSQPCTPADGVCPPLVLADADPTEEGGQLPVPAPELSVLGPVLFGLGLWLWRLRARFRGILKRPQSKPAFFRPSKI